MAATGSTVLTKFQDKTKAVFAPRAPLKSAAGQYKMPTNAVSFSTFGTKNRGIFSVNDQEEIAKNIEKQQKKLGGVARWAPVDENGMAVAGAIINDPDTGLAFTVGAKGLTEIDEEAMDYKRELLLQQQKYVDKIMSYLILDNETAQQCLNLSPADYLEWTQAGSVEFTNAFAGYSTGLNVDCSAEYLEALPSDSKEYSLGLAKLRLICRLFLPKLKKHTGTRAVLHANDEK